MFAQSRQMQPALNEIYVVKPIPATQLMQVLKQSDLIEDDRLDWFDPFLQQFGCYFFESIKDGVTESRLRNHSTEPSTQGPDDASGPVKRSQHINPWFHKLKLHELLQFKQVRAIFSVTTYGFALASARQAAACNSRAYEPTENDRS